MSNNVIFKYMDENLKHLEISTNIVPIFKSAFINNQVFVLRFSHLIYFTICNVSFWPETV